MNEEQLSKIIPVKGVLNLSPTLAKKLNVKPAILRNQFIRKLLIPFMKDTAARIAHEQGIDIKNNDYTVLGRKAISSIRKAVKNEFGEIQVNGERYNLNQVNELFRNERDGIQYPDSKVLTKHSTTNKENRLLAAYGLSGVGEKQAAFYDSIDKFEKQLNNSLAQNANNPRRRERAYNRFDNQMRSLFEDNRDWLDKNAYYDPDTYAGQYGWKEGQSREGHASWQREVYTESQNQSRALAREIGINIDAGHALALGKYHVSKEEFNSYDIPLKQLIRDGAEPDPDNEGGWIIRGTNSASNLAVEIAKLNRAKGNRQLPRTLEQLLKMNTAFTKSLGLQEYLLKDDKTFRKDTDFNRIFRSLLKHTSEEDIDALNSRAEDRILDVGIETPSISKLGLGELNQLQNVTQGGAVTTLQGNPKALNSQYSNVGRFTRVPDGKGGFQLFDPNTGTMFGMPQVGPQQFIDAAKGLAEFGLEHSVNVLGAYSGNPQIGTQIKAGFETVQAVKDKDPLGAIMSVHRAVSPGITTQEPYYKSQPSHKLVGR